ncbi:MAG: archaeal/vacuolar-type H+-ATPase subunit I, partial [Candidatus Thermoplasmatota archaeon]
VAESSFDADLIHTYEKETFIDIFSGPDFAFIKEGDKVRVEFIPWHRRWSHSFTVGFLFAPLGLLLYGFTQLGLIASAIIVLSFYAHIFVDQIGMLGSNLFYPFTKKRSKGVGLVHSGDALPNIYTNYVAILLVIWNLNFFAPKQVFQMPIVRYMVLSGGVAYLLGLLNYMIFFAVIPLTVIYVLVRIYKKRIVKAPKLTKEEAVAEEALREIEEIVSR